ncbi:BREX-1 system adenine-specific DNA-methyltransferase PglX [Polaribacter sp. 11A2H]|uniref:BREX-1 system adenine-specific DNA-methyltransferase PglX n=1 Tax=Polaribacter sp. 11A2H TaxID=2687290 RepID=UPI00140DF14A|nr:BREX-1 system adenine-specific DNA-methyltransferase PglX [Polaribacter sp. 11A2H]
MALTQGARNKIKSFVQSAKKLLMNEFLSQIQQYYGIRPDGSYLMVEELTTNDGSIIQTARLLRERLSYLEETIAGNNKKEEAVEQLVREQAFTILNRFAALRMAEDRNIIPEAIKKGYNSEGFQVFDQLSGGAQSADQFVRYTWFLKAMFDELAIDLPAVFARFSPYALLFPSEKVMLELLDIIDDEDLSIYREEGHQPINLWEEDETIGWVYQYYNSREEISAMRDASGAPRNSRELAVRNQFFTPRYVVQFLVDNSLGRQWFEMTKGQTNLVDSCQYMVKRKHEIFLEKGEAIPEAKIEGANYIEYRILKDPREILMLDPACGSMHFGLYSFDLFEKIYIEAWDNYPDLLLDLRDKYLRADYIKQIPGFILAHNIHGVDIDPRAIQIAGLSLWLRAQKSYKSLGLQPAERPAIQKSNLVVAEPMPGDASLLNEFTRSLPGPIGKLVRVIWDKMQLAGETGLLLKIEEELKKEIEIAKAEYNKYKGGSTQTSIFGGTEDSKAAEMAAIYGENQKISKDFFETAEDEVLKALQNFAENAEGDNAFQKLLFAEDTARGFAFIELCRKRYDVIVMNPPFGSTSKGTKLYIDLNYPESNTELAAVFMDRMNGMLNINSLLGAITTRTIFFMSSLRNWRKKTYFERNRLPFYVDLGSGVLDAMVETAATISINGITDKSLFYRLTKMELKAKELERLVKEKNDKDIYSIDTTILSNISNEPLCYWVDEKTVEMFINSPKFENNDRGAKQGLATADNPRFVRNIWEIKQLSTSEQENQYMGWSNYLMGQESIRFYSDFNSCVNWKKSGNELCNFFNERGKIKSRPQGIKHYYLKGISWSYRTSKFQPHLISSGAIPSHGRIITVFPNDDEILSCLGYWNTEYVDYLIKLSMEADSGNPRFANGTINKLPHPILNSSINKELKRISLEQYYYVKEVFRLEEKSLAFTSNSFVNEQNLLSFKNKRKEILEKNKVNYLDNLRLLNNLVYNYFSISKEEQIDIKEIISKAGEASESKVFEVNPKAFIENIFTTIIGSAFGKWDIRIIKLWKKVWSDEGVFKARKHSPFLYGKKESTLDLVLPEYHDNIKEIWKMPYPIEVLEDCATVSDINPIVDKLKEVIKYFWPETFDTIEEELVDHFKVNDLGEIIDKHSKFFDAHLKDYSRNKRISPIYWHLCVPSGKFSVWIYYPKLNDNSLYKIINELVDPKLDEVAKEVEALELNGSTKDFNDQKEFLEELEDFKEELLRVAQLPYKPNQDDGVLITAAPLHNLFGHTKWRKSTEACWKKLEKGEYDWAHLAYSIWPDRVTNKCKKDLSMAIAHGLESICEVKPKEKKTRKKPTVKEETQNKLL